MVCNSAPPLRDSPLCTPLINLSRSPRDSEVGASSSSSGSFAALALKSAMARARTMQRAPQQEKLRMSIRKLKATESAAAGVGELPCAPQKHTQRASWSD